MLPVASNTPAIAPACSNRIPRKEYSIHANPGADCVLGGSECASMSSPVPEIRGFVSGVVLHRSKDEFRKSIAFGLVALNQASGYGGWLRRSLPFFVAIQTTYGAIPESFPPRCTGVRDFSSG